jgi:hypothetical protein
MKTISIRQPWASLIIRGYLHGITRDWSRTYRGPLAIHAGRGQSPESEALYRDEPWKSALRELGYHEPGDLPVGVILGVVLLVRIDLTKEITDPVLQTELSFGESRLRRFTWLFAHATALELSPPVAGRAALFDTTNSLILPHLPANQLGFWRQALVDQYG